MESKGNKNSQVLMFGLSFNLILTLGSLGFTCYSLHRLDSRLTAVEHDLLLTNPTYQLDSRRTVEPPFTHPNPSGSQMKETVRVKRAADRPSMGRKCSSACLKSNDHPNVSYFVYLYLYVLQIPLDLSSNVEFGFERKLTSRERADQSDFNHKNRCWLAHRNRE